MTATLARDCSAGFAPEDFRHTAALLRSGDDLVVITLSNNLNIVLAALDQAGSHAALVSALKAVAGLRASIRTWSLSNRIPGWQNEDELFAAIDDALAGAST